jgi:hypothetical protein
MHSSQLARLDAYKFALIEGNARVDLIARVGAAEHQQTKWRILFHG